MDVGLDPVALVRELVRYPRETAWFEFKENLEDPTEIGEYISCLSNSATLEGRDHGYVIWGISNDSHKIVGTRFDPYRKKIGSEDLEPWLRRLISPDLDFKFYVQEVDGVRIVVLAIPSAYRTPSSFKNTRYVRVDSYKKVLSMVPETEARLFELLRNARFEERAALSVLGLREVLELLDFAALFRLMDEPLPGSLEAIGDALSLRQLVRREDDGRWTITNLGAVVLAVDLQRFDSLSSKAVRLVHYSGKGKSASRSETSLPSQGYAVIFEQLLTVIRGLLPQNEVIRLDLRQDVPMYPNIALREIVANALVHQDFAVRGSGPMIEIFSDRLVVRNPGNPLVATDRFLDQDRSRNERLVELMRRLKICEKSGSGVDKAMAAIEMMQLPAPEFRSDELMSPGVGETVVTPFAHKTFNQMNVEERTKAAYWHSAFMYIENDRMSNSSLRQRFGLDDSYSSSISLVIKKALADNRIRLEDPAVGNKAMRYLPWWA